MRKIEHPRRSISRVSELKCQDSRSCSKIGTNSNRKSSRDILFIEKSKKHKHFKADQQGKVQESKIDIKFFMIFSVIYYVLCDIFLKFYWDSSYISLYCKMIYIIIRYIFEYTYISQFYFLNRIINHHIYIYSGSFIQPDDYLTP